MVVLIQFWNKGRMRYYLFAVHMMVFWILISCIGQLLDMNDNVYLRNAKVSQYKLYDNYIGELKRTNLLFIVYIFIISIIGFAVECQTRVLQLRRKYAIANLSGYSRKNIMLSVGIGIFLELLIPALLVSGFDYIMYKSTYIYPYLLAYMICVLVISFATCAAAMAHENYWQDVRGKRHGNHLS